MNGKLITAWFSSSLILLLLGTSCGGGTGKVEPPAAGTIQAPVFRAARSVLPVYVTAVGALEPYNRAQLSTRVMGNVTEVLVREGDRVRRGQALLRLDMRDLSGRIEQGEAMLSGAKSRLENAEAYYNRIKNLYEDRSATKQALDNALSQYESSRAEVRAAEGRLSEARSNLDYSIISAPFAGYVTSRGVERGDLASPGLPLIVLEQQDSMKIVATLNERDISAVAAGDEALVETDLPGVGRRQAVVEAVIPSADPRTRSFRVRLVLDNSDGALKSGVFARVLFRTGESPMIAVPKDAVIRRGQLTGLYTVDENNLTRLRWIRAGKESADMLEILSGLEPGENVIVAGDRVIAEGMKVQEVSR